MTVRSLPSLRDTLFLLLVILLTAAFAFQITKATPKDWPSTEMPDSRAIRVLSPVLLAGEASLPTFSPATLRTGTPAMPLERDILALRGLRPARQNLLYDHSAPHGSRPTALATLYKISPKIGFHSVRTRSDRELSDRVRTTTENTPRNGWTPEMGPQA